MEGEKKVKLEFEVAPETAVRIEYLLSDHLWERPDGLRLIMGAGIGALLADQATGEHDDCQNQLANLKRELVRSEGRLSRIQFELAEIKEMNRRWELSTGSIHSTNATLEKVILQLNAEITDLRAQLNSKLEENNQLQARLSAEYITIIAPNKSKKNLLDRLMGS